jgi:peptide deformylase
MFTLVPSLDKALYTRSEPVRPDDIPALRKQLYWLQKLMKAGDGAGLSANQVGDLRRYFVWKTGMVINPELLSTTQHTATLAEGCLSFPGIKVMKTRPYGITVRYIDERGMPIQRGYDGFAARVFLHELDHLNGICIA